MDAVAALLDAPWSRSRGTALLRVVFDPPFAVRVADRAPLTLMTPVRGQAWIVDDGPGGGAGGGTGAGAATTATPAAHRLVPGDVALVRGPLPYTVADPVDAPVTSVVHPDNTTTTPGGAPLCDDLDLGVRSWGDRADAATLLLVGTYRAPGEIAGPLLAALPRTVVLEAGTWACPYLPLLAEATGRDAPGQDAVLDRLLDLTLIEAVRAWFARPGSQAPAWYAAQADPVVGRVLTLMHDDPAQPWTLPRLARSAGVSRAALARRFVELVGEPPMTHLTGWRLALAADLLREPGTTLAAVARQVGYGSPFALSAAFKRVRGTSPETFRQALT